MTLGGIVGTGLTASADRRGLADERLVDLVRVGDAEATDVLVARYTAYARGKTRTYFLVGADNEDVVQEGMIGLFKAIRDYDPARAMSFRNFAELCITRQILTAIKAATRRKHGPLNSYVSLHGTPDAPQSLDEALTEPRTADPVELVVATDEAARIRGFLGEILSELEAEVLALYLGGQSYQDIAVTLGRGAKSIDNALQRIKRKLEGFLHASRLAEDAALVQTAPAAGA